MKNDLLRSRGKKPRTGKILRCKECRTEFYVKPSQISFARYCSKECQRKAFTQGKVKKCAICGTEFRRAPSQERLRGARYCSYACAHKGLGKRSTGSKNRAWKGSRIKISRLDGYFSKFIRLRDGLCCVRCGKQYVRGDQGLHCSHFIGRAHMATRFDPDNCDAFCWGCHRFMETHKATTYREWKIKQLGQERFDLLIERSREVGNFDREATGVRVRELLKEVNDGRLN